MKRDELLGQLNTAGIAAKVLHGANGASAVVTAHGARVLGLFTHRHAENAYWVNPELRTMESARKFLAGEHVLGGDRLWLAPERGLFFKGNSLADGVTTQPAIDPGSWVIGGLTEQSIRLSHELSAMYFHHATAPVRAAVERSIRMIPSPFLNAPGAVPLARTHYVGYEIASRFELLESPLDDLHIGLWFLIQLVVPHGGYLYAPTYGKAVITGDYYEPTGHDYLKVTETHVRFKLDSIHRHKIGIRKTESSGRAAFLSNPVGGEKAGHDGPAMLVVRNFLNNPSGHYSDVPLHTPAGTQDSIQSYNHNTGPEGFGELEFHTPGITRGMAEPVLYDTNQVWTFSGPRGDLVAIASKLLGLPVETFSL